MLVQDHPIKSHKIPLLTVCLLEGLVVAKSKSDCHHLSCQAPSTGEEKKTTDLLTFPLTSQSWPCCQQHYYHTPYTLCVIWIWLIKSTLNHLSTAFTGHWSLILLLLHTAHTHTHMCLQLMVLCLSWCLMKVRKRGKINLYLSYANCVNGAAYITNLNVVTNQIKRTFKRKSQNNTFEGSIGSTISLSVFYLQAEV